MAVDTLFRSTQGGAGGATDYVKDAFDDGSLQATSNTGLTDSATTNPMGDLLGNTDCPRFGPKTLLIKDLVLEQDRSKWINNRQTFRIIWSETYPAVTGYVVGGVVVESKTGQPVVSFKEASAFIGVNGIIRRLAWLLDPITSTGVTATAQASVDGVNSGSPFDFGLVPTEQAALTVARYTPFLVGSANETKDIHDFRLSAIQVNTLRVIGVIAYSENSGQTIDVGPGTTYVDKSKVTSTVGASLSLASYGSSLGGVALVYKTQSAGYAVSALSATTITSVGSGSIGTALLSVASGHGSSFPAGCGVVASTGSSQYVGSVISVSTDTLTVQPDLPFALSGASLYRSWLGGPTYAINASLMTLSRTVDLGAMYGFTPPIIDPRGAYLVSSEGTAGITFIASLGGDLRGGIYKGLAFPTQTGNLNVGGRFSAAEIEIIGNGRFHATLSINGVPSWSINEGLSGPIKRTIVTDAGTGWNSFVLTAGGSMSALNLISKINLYERSNEGITFGALGVFRTNQGIAHRSSLNASLMALGTYQRYVSDQFYTEGNWDRQISGAYPGYSSQVGSSGAVLNFQFYGKAVGVIGTLGGGTLSIDGIGIGASFGMLHSVTEGFHELLYAVGNGTTATILAVDVVRSHSEIEDAQNIITSGQLSPSQLDGPSELRMAGGAGSGVDDTAVRVFRNLIKYTGKAISLSSEVVNGTVVRILEAGRYYIEYVDSNSTDSFQMGVCLNTAANGTSLPSTLSASQRLAYNLTTPSASGNKPHRASTTVYLNVGDEIRCHTTIGIDGSASVVVGFSILKLE